MMLRPTEFGVTVPESHSAEAVNSQRNTPRRNAAILSTATVP